MLYCCWLSVLGRMGRTDEFINGFGVDSDAAVDDCRSLEAMAIVPMVINLAGKGSRAASLDNLLQFIQEAIKTLKAALPSSGAVDYRLVTQTLGLAELDESQHPLFQTAFVAGKAIDSNKDAWQAVCMRAACACFFVTVRCDFLVHVMLRPCM
eukprot:5284194-Amphidinium_carterae.1